MRLLNICWLSARHPPSTIFTRLPDNTARHHPSALAVSRTRRLAVVATSRALALAPTFPRARAPRPRAAPPCSSRDGGLREHARGEAEEDLLRVSHHQVRARRVPPGARRGEVQVPHRGAPEVPARRRVRRVDRARRAGAEPRAGGAARRGSSSSVRRDGSGARREFVAYVVCLSTRSHSRSDALATRFIARERVTPFLSFAALARLSTRLRSLT